MGYLQARDHLAVHIFSDVLAIPGNDVAAQHGEHGVSNAFQADIAGDFVVLVIERLRPSFLASFTM